MYVLCGYICCKENCPGFPSIREQDHVEKGEVDTRAAYTADVWRRGVRQAGEPNSSPGMRVIDESGYLLCQDSGALGGCLLCGELPWSLGVTP